MVGWPRSAYSGKLPFININLVIPFFHSIAYIIIIVPALYKTVLDVKKNLAIVFTAFL